ncbi:DeoR/GlpR family DNA-binding transcription regulator [Azospirillum sp. ST 5-10]|uniref:DeoR/GlpR family DNA-binding transcription regulator n=1 Tax=unclassified Azospirillum TaxID=2630922 RepID=UPI003F4A22E7
MSEDPASDAASVLGALTPRQRSILEIVTAQGFATVDALARRFDVSAQSIRRDIIRLDEVRLLQRFHGGAGVRETAAVRLGYAQKQRAASDAKERIGRAAAALVPDGGSVFLDVGTTAEAVARALRGRAGLRVFTCSLPAAMLLAGDPGVEVFVTGGLVRGADGSLVGDHAVQAVARFRVDVAVLGFSGFDEDGALMDFDMQKVAVKQAILAAARRGVAVGDAAKFSRTAVVRLAPPSAFSAIVSDGAPPAPLRERLEAAGVALVRA